MEHASAKLGAEAPRAGMDIAGASICVMSVRAADSKHVASGGHKKIVTAEELLSFIGRMPKKNGSNKEGTTVRVDGRRPQSVGRSEGCSLRDRNSEACKCDRRSSAGIS